MRSEGPADGRHAAWLDDPSLVDLADLAAAFGTNLERGLGAEEAATRLRADGPNELRAVPPVSAQRRALAQLQDPLVYLLGAVAAVAVAQGTGHAVVTATGMQTEVGGIATLLDTTRRADATASRDRSSGPGAEHRCLGRGCRRGGHDPALVGH